MNPHNPDAICLYARRTRKTPAEDRRAFLEEPAKPLDPEMTPATEAEHLAKVREGQKEDAQMHRLSLSQKATQ